MKTNSFKNYKFICIVIVFLVLSLSCTDVPISNNSIINNNSLIGLWQNSPESAFEIKRNSNGTGSYIEYEYKNGSFTKTYETLMYFWTCKDSKGELKYISVKDKEGEYYLTANYLTNYNGELILKYLNPSKLKSEYIVEDDVVKFKSSINFQKFVQKYMRDNNLYDDDDIQPFKKVNSIYELDKPLKTENANFREFHEEIYKKDQNVKDMIWNGVYKPDIFVYNVVSNFPTATDINKYKYDSHQRIAMLKQNGKNWELFRKHAEQRIKYYAEKYPGSESFIELFYSLKIFSPSLVGYPIRFPESELNNFFAHIKVSKDSNCKSGIRYTIFNYDYATFSNRNEKDDKLIDLYGKYCVNP